MKIRRFCLSAALFLFSFAACLQAARLPENDLPFQAAFTAPDAGQLPLWDTAAWLGIGAALVCLMLSACVSLMVRGEGSRVQHFKKMR